MPTTDKTRKQRKTSTVTTVAAWSKRGIHQITLPSGAEVRIRIPDLSVLLANDAVPDELRQVALDEIQSELANEQAAASGQPLPPPSFDVERLRGLGDLHRFLVSETLVEPEMTMEEVEEADLPADDLLMLTQIATRQRNTDARGVVLGIEPLDRWELWRQAHSCPDECEHCLDVLEALTTSVGA